MAYFPFFIEVKDKKCIVFGGGPVAFRKILALLEFEANITVIAPAICGEIAELGDKIILCFREYKKKDIADAFFVIAATGDRTVNSAIAKACRDKKILINVVDVMEECDFLFPAYVKKGRISVGITTSGSSPLMAGRIRKAIDQELPDYYEEVVDSLGSYREYIKKTILSEHKRAEVWKELADICIEKKCRLTSEEVEAVLARYTE